MVNDTATSEIRGQILQGRAVQGTLRYFLWGGSLFDYRGRLTNPFLYWLVYVTWIYGPVYHAVNNVMALAFTLTCVLKPHLMQNRIEPGKSCITITAKFNCNSRTK